MLVPNVHRSEVPDMVNLVGIGDDGDDAGVGGDDNGAALQPKNTTEKTPVRNGVTRTSTLSQSLTPMRVREILTQRAFLSMVAVPVKNGQCKFPQFFLSPHKHDIDNFLIYWYSVRVNKAIDL